ncbi:exonuclease SbcCD subunit D [Paenibacillus sp. GCM10027627]|uniref:exonuclease SbcCD subunit D n=1 Tax=unclassified Paenibacillus TaxID=185978 RepID=UPI003624B21D
MKLFHTADWHLGKLVQGVYMTEDQKYVLEQFMEEIRNEKPDAVIIAGDLYDRAVPPTEAVELLDHVLETIVLELKTPVLAIAGNHDSPDRINFGTRMMESRGLHLVGQLRPDSKPVVLCDEYGEVHFHLIPYADPSMVRHVLEDDSIRSHDDAVKAIVHRISAGLDTEARHVFVGHAFVTPGGESAANTSESERPLSIGGAEHVRSDYFAPFHYTALGHLHQAHYVKNDNIRYAGSPLKYSISEEKHIKGYYIVELDGSGVANIEKRELKPQRDMRRIETTVDELAKHARSDDYVYVTLLSDHTILFPMERVRTIYPNALHVEQKPLTRIDPREDGASMAGDGKKLRRSEIDPAELFASFYLEVKGRPLSEAKKELFALEYGALLKEEGGGA